MKGNEMEWLTNWNENYSLAILFFGLAICFFGVIVYLFMNYRRLLGGDKKQGKT